MLWSCYSRRRRMHGDLESFIARPIVKVGTDDGQAAGGVTASMVRSAVERRTELLEHELALSKKRNEEAGLRLVRMERDMDRLRTAAVEDAGISGFMTASFPDTNNSNNDTIPMKELDSLN